MEMSLCKCTFISILLRPVSQHNLVVKNNLQNDGMKMIFVVGRREGERQLRKKDKLKRKEKTKVQMEEQRLLLS